MIQVPIHHFNFSDLSADTMMLWSAMLIFTSCDVNLEQKFEIKTSAIISNQRYPSSRFSLFLLVWSRVVDIILNIIFDRMWDTIPHCWHITQGQALHFTDRIQTTRGSDSTTKKISQLIRIYGCFCNVQVSTLKPVVAKKWRTRCAYFCRMLLSAEKKKLSKFFFHRIYSYWGNRANSFYLTVSYHKNSDWQRFIASKAY